MLANKVHVTLFTNHTNLSKFGFSFIPVSSVLKSLNIKLSTHPVLFHEFLHRGEITLHLFEGRLVLHQQLGAGGCVPVHRG